jgi:valyl-tRNA synthetase
VKFYEKGDRPLELIPTLQWYTRILDKKEALVAQGRKIAWHPDYMYKRYEHWVEGLNQDWCLSRQRYFGVPIPVWYRIDANGVTRFDERLVPAKDRLPVDPMSEVPEGYTESQRGKPGGFAADPDVFDTWATSSLTPQIESHWVDDLQRHRKLFPMDMRPQAHEIIRTWAFYTIVKAYLHEREVPWHNVVISGWVLDPDRKKMSKSQGNVVTPEPLVNEYGADAVRYWAARARLGVDTAFDEQIFKVGKRLCTKLFNASKFVMGRYEGLDPAKLTPERITCESDRAAIAELRPLLRRATEALNEFDYAQALALVDEFFWNTFCDNYLELAKPRTYDEGETDGRLSAAATLRLLHRAVVRLFAPFLPFLTEEIWHWNYTADPDMHPSVHRSPWPSLDEFAAVAEPSSARIWPLTLQVVEAVRKAKADANLSIKAPVQRVAVVCNVEDGQALNHAVLDVTRMLSVEQFDLDDKPEQGEFVVTVELDKSQPTA